MIVGVLQARSSSRRLPRKVLSDLAGAPMILRQVERLRRASRLDRLVIATTTDPSDGPLVEVCESAGLAVHRGSVDDVLERVIGAAAGAAHVARLTGDCPLTDPDIVDLVIETHLAGRHDYTSNAHERTFPDGLDVEVMRYDALARAALEATLPSEREHVTPYLYGHPELFDLGSVTQGRDLSALRWTVDEAVDLEFVRQVYGALYPVNPAFTTADVLALLAERPELGRMNDHIPTNEGYVRSLEEDPE